MTMEDKIERASGMECRAASPFPHRIVHPVGFESYCQHCHATVSAIVAEG